MHCGSKSPHGEAGAIGCVFFFCLFVAVSLLGFGSVSAGLLVLSVACFFFFIWCALIKENKQPSFAKAPEETDDYPSHEDYNDYEKTQEDIQDEPEHIEYWDIIERVPVNTSFIIEYTDAKGRLSERLIDISYYDGTCYLDGYCHLRDKNRTFRVDRVVSCVDADSGEFIEDIPSYLRLRYESSSEFKLNKAFEIAPDILKILYYVGKADGQLRAKELSIIGNVVRKIAKDNSITDVDIRKKLVWMGVPSLHGFKIAVGRTLKSSPKNLAIVQKLAVKIVKTQKTISPGENEALLYLEKKYRRHKNNQKKEK